MKRKFKTLDANEAVAKVAYGLSEVIAIYPITPSSPIGEWADQWASEHVPNIWGTVPHVVEMQSEGGAAGRSERLNCQHPSQRNRSAIQTNRPRWSVAP